MKRRTPYVPAPYFWRYDNLYSILNRILPSFLFVSMLVISVIRDFKKLINLIYRIKKVKLSQGA